MGTNKILLSPWSAGRYTRHERKIAKEVQAFLPSNVCDSHAHIYKLEHFHREYVGEKARWFQNGPAEVRIWHWRSLVKKLAGRSNVRGGLISPAPLFKVKHVEEENRFLIQELDGNQDCYGLIVVTPDFQASQVEKYLSHPRIVGLKPYYVYTKEKPAWNSSPLGYFPEHLWKIAHDHELIILLHLVRHGLADADNVRLLKKMCIKYPNVKLILAHLGGCFNAYNVETGAAALKGLGNIWLDTSVVCEAETIVTVIKHFGVKKILWGSDFPLSQRRGRCVTIGDGFIWLDTESIDWEKFARTCQPVLFGLESLRALKQAAYHTRLSSCEIQDIFCDNMLRLVSRG